MAKNKMTANTESELLLSIKDIERIKKENIEVKRENQKKTLDKSIEKYNKGYIDALNAPTPDIKLPFSEVLLRAVPLEIKGKHGIILSAGAPDMRMMDKLDRLTFAVQEEQEILLVGDTVTEKQQTTGGITPGRIAKLNLKHFRSMSDRHHAGMIEMDYDIPIEVIDGHRYIVCDVRSILYTREKEE